MVTLELPCYSHPSRACTSAQVLVLQCTQAHTGQEIWMGEYSNIPHVTKENDAQCLQASLLLQSHAHLLGLKGLWYGGQIGNYLCGMEKHRFMKRNAWGYFPQAFLHVVEGRVIQMWYSLSFLKTSEHLVPFVVIGDEGLCRWLGS